MERPIRRSSRTSRDPRPRHPRTTLDPRERAFVEDFGIFFEQMDSPRMAGRIVGRLLVAEPPEQSSAQLMRYLGASKGSISTMSRLLIERGLIERVGIPGERIDHFRLRADGFARLTEAQLRQTAAIRELLGRALGLPAAQRSAVRRRIEAVDDFYAFFHRELLAALERFEPRASAPGRARPARS